MCILFSPNQDFSTVLFFLFTASLGTLVAWIRVKLMPVHLTGTLPAEKTTSRRKCRRLVFWGISGLVIFILASLLVLPSFLCQANKVKGAEGKVNVGSMNRAQQSFVLENDKFASDIPSLGLGINPETTNNSYKIQVYNGGKRSYAIATATPKQDGLKSYVGGVFLTTTLSNEMTTVAILCESKQPSKIPPSPPQLVGGSPRCASGSTELL